MISRIHCFDGILFSLQLVSNIGYKNCSSEIKGDTEFVDDVTVEYFSAEIGKGIGGLE